MDPKALNNMDPKLRETYQRVMGTAGPTTPPPAAPGQNPTNPASSSGAANAPFSQSFAASPPMPIPPPSSAAAVLPPDGLSSTPSPQPVQPVELKAGLTAETVTPAQEEAALKPLPSPASVNQATHASHGPSPLIRGLYIAAGVIFFIVYAVFWLKIFNYPLPF